MRKALCSGEAPSACSCSLLPRAQCSKDKEAHRDIRQSARQEHVPEELALSFHSATPVNFQSPRQCTLQLFEIENGRCSANSATISRRCTPLPLHLARQGSALPVRRVPLSTACTFARKPRRAGRHDMTSFGMFRVRIVTSCENDEC